MLKKILRKLLKKYLQMRFKMSDVGASIILEKYLKDYKNCNKKETLKVFLCHRRGFTYTDWNILNLNKKNYKKYLSSISYLSMHPINCQYSSWIDDKLTLKYICNGTKLDKYMPKYFAQIDENGIIHKLMDYPKNEDENSILEPNQIAELVNSLGGVAFKLICASTGVGFYKASFVNNNYYLNDVKMSKKEFCEKISSLKNYIITEYFYTCKEFKKYSDKSVNCLRYLAGRVDGKLEFLKSYIRFGTNKSGYVENYNNGGILCFVDENGEFEFGNIIENGKNKKINVHPNNNSKLNGNIPKWNQIKNAIKEFDLYFPQLKYLGFDFIINDKEEIKILEINSLSSLDAIQLNCPIKDDLNIWRFFKNYIS